MPAVNPTRLRFQIEEVLTHFDSPKAFHQSLSALFGAYSYRALRFGEYSPSKPLIPMYHIPDPVLRQLEYDLKPLLQSDPEAALACADEIWNDPYFEVSKVAIFILGNIPADDPQIIIERLSTWLNPGLDRALADHLLSEGTRQLQDNFPDAWEAFIGAYLSSQNPKLINLGLKGLSEGLKRTSFTNLPAIFRIISPFLRDPQFENTRAVENLLKVLADRSPNETVYFLKQTLAIVDNFPELTRLVKSILPLLPSQLQNELKAALSK
jgi:hypothetical protein